MKILVILILSINFLFASVDINNADATTLSTLKGIGVSKAAAIVSFRKTHCFKNVSELTLVKGVGRKTLEKNRANLTAGSCKR